MYIWIIAIVHHIYNCEINNTLFLLWFVSLIVQFIVQIVLVLQFSWFNYMLETWNFNCILYMVMGVDWSINYVIFVFIYLCFAKFWCKLVPVELVNYLPLRLTTWWQLWRIHASLRSQTGFLTGRRITRMVDILRLCPMLWTWSSGMILSVWRRSGML